MFFLKPSEENNGIKTTLGACNVSLTESRRMLYCRKERAEIHLLWLQMGITTLDTEQNAGKTCTYYVHATLQRSAVKVVVMRILLQPFTSFGCHGYTAGGPSSWTPRREQGEGGMLGSLALSVRLPRLSFHASANWTWHLKRKKKKNVWSAVAL